MLNLVILLSLSIFNSVVAEPLDWRIVGGDEASPFEIPYIVSIRMNNIHFCGGSIISEKFVLTAAHCVRNWTHQPEIFSIQYGTIEISTDASGSNIIPVKNIIKHEKYVHSGGYIHDIAVMEIDGTFSFGPAVTPVQLPESANDDPGFEVDLLVAGWGIEKENGRLKKFLRKVILTRFSDTYCQVATAQYYMKFHICAGVYTGGKGHCTGDSGGPVTYDGVQYGIVSWSNKPCGSYGNPGIYTKVATYRDWIKNKTGI